MQEVFEYIKTHSSTFNKKPLFVHLRDERVDPVRRLEFVPHVAHFVMTFADLYHFFLTENPPSDRYHELINTHLAEEGSHWKWFLRDLTSLDLDPTIRFTDAIRFIWSDATVKTRRLAYEMCKLTGGLSSLHKLVMVLAIEATGRVGLEAAVPAGRQVEANSGKKIVYFGQHHLDTERAHTVEDRAVHQSLADLELSPATRAELHAVVDSVFEHFLFPSPLADGIVARLMDGHRGVGARGVAAMAIARGGGWSPRGWPSREAQRRFSAGWPSGRRQPHPPRG